MLGMRHELKPGGARAGLVLCGALGLGAVATPVHATFYCNVVENGAPLMAQPHAEAKVLQDLSGGAVVSLFDEAQDKKGAWVRVAYDLNGQEWGAGQKGWMREADLTVCG